MQLNDCDTFLSGRKASMLPRMHTMCLSLISRTTIGRVNAVCTCTCTFEKDIVCHKLLIISMQELQMPVVVLPATSGNSIYIFGGKTL